MMDATKYAPGYYPVPAGYDSWVKKDHIEKAPAWCSVDPVSYTHLDVYKRQ